MKICILCEESKVQQVRQKMKNNNILKIPLSPTGEFPATHKMCVMRVSDERGRQILDLAELTIMEEIEPSDFLEKHNLKEIRKKLI
jgi:hypothetical protein